MPSIRTHEIFAEGLTPHLVKKVAASFGLSEGTVRAWRQPKESDIDPTGRGKGNPLDQVERYIRDVHPSNSGNARMAAEYLVDVCDELDHAAGVIEPESILTTLRVLIRESADVTGLLACAQFDKATSLQALSEIADLRAALERLDAAVRAKIGSLG